MNSEDLYRIPTIETQHGFFNLDARSFDIFAVAGGLAKKCRFNGQSARFYSVAEHSLLVAKLMARFGGDPFEGLMHDANEAYLPDVPSPYKSSLPDLRALENKLDTRIREYFRIPETKTEQCGWADCVALMIEAFDLMPSKGAGSYWSPMAAYRIEALKLIDEFRIQCWAPEQAERMFLDDFYQRSLIR